MPQGTYVMVNKTSNSIDSLFLNHGSSISTFEFNKETDLVLEDTLYDFDIYKLKQAHCTLEIVLICFLRLKINPTQ